MFWLTFYELCRNNKTTPNSVARELGLSSGSVTTWKQGKVPHHGTLIKIADFFGVSVDYLLGANEIKSNVIDLSLCDKEVADVIKKVLTLSKEEVIALKQILKA